MDGALLYRRVGHPVKDKEFLKSISPLFYVDNIKKISQYINSHFIERSLSLGTHIINPVYWNWDDDENGEKMQINVHKIWVHIILILEVSCSGQRVHRHSLKKYIYFGNTKKSNK